ncbi:hypothetical protein FACS1894159_06980 [Bacteroidia bacterium]|nr:hypothetical protein FACS1894159_06980 [Bacteroidia bacterium]
MKNIIIISIFSLLCIEAAAQVDYYANHDTVAGSNVIYKVKSTASNYFYIISNINNTYDDEPIRYHNGQLAERNDKFTATQIGDRKQLYRQAIEETFTAAEITGLRSSNEWVDVSYKIDLSGNIMEVHFMFPKHPKMYSIPPDKWFTLEQKIKTYIKFSIPERSKVVTFLAASIRVYFDKLYN